MEFSTIAQWLEQALGAAGTIAGIVAAIHAVRANRTAHAAVSSAVNAERQSIQTQASTDQTSADIAVMSRRLAATQEELADARVDLLEAANAMAEQRDAIWKMAENTDTLLTAHLKTLTFVTRERIPEKVRRLEGWAQTVSQGNQRPGPLDDPLPTAPASPAAADDPYETGRHRFPTRAIPTVQQEQP